MSVTVVSCVYGDYDRFVDRWFAALDALDPAPHDAIVATDERLGILQRPFGIELTNMWVHPQAFYLNAAINQADTDWVVIADIDDLLMPDALAGLEDVQADVWQLGFERSDGETYIPPTLTAEEILALDRNVLVGSSAIRTESFHAVGGFPDIALQDWGLWRRMARAGMTFESSGRTHFHYMRHEATRGATELTIEARAGHLAEMMEAELAVV